MRSLAPINKFYLKRSAGGGQCYFELKDNDGEMLGRSTVFANEQGTQRGINSLRSGAGRSKLLDLTGGD